MSVDYSDNSFEYTKLFDVNSSVIDGVYFNENDNTVFIDVDSTYYLYTDVDAEDVADLVRSGDEGSVGAYYNTYFKSKFQGEKLGSYWDWAEYLVSVNKETPGTAKGWVTTPETVTIQGAVKVEPTKEHSLQISSNRSGINWPSDSGVDTREFSLAEIPAKPALEPNEDYRTTVVFTLDDYDREYTYNAGSESVEGAVEELNDYVSAMGAKGKVRKVVVEFA